MPQVWAAAVHYEDAMRALEGMVEASPACLIESGGGPLPTPELAALS